MTILVTGGTGTLGRPVVALLRGAGHDLRVLSRTKAPGVSQGDLSTTEGLAQALAGTTTVLHLATTASSKDAEQSRNLVEACRAANIGHLIFSSIVGVDTIPYSYYRAKRVSERTIEESGIPYTILRATQFHEFIALIVRLQRRMPALLSLDIPVQPIAVDEVARRLAGLVGAGPAGRLPDIGGPEQLRLRAAIATIQAASGRPKPVVIIPLLGKTVKAFKRGDHMPGLPGFGKETLGDFAARASRNPVGSAGE